MKTIRLAALAALTGLAVSCGSATLLDTVQTEVTRWGTEVPSPTVSPSSGAYRLTTDVPTVTLTANSAPTRLFYTTNGTTPVYNTVGNNQYPTTQRTDMDTLGTFTVPITITAGVNAVRAVAWRSDGKVSAEGSATYRVVGDGGVVWARAGLGASGGQILAGTRSSYSASNWAGGWITDSAGRKSGCLMRYDDAGNQIAGALIQGPSTGTTAAIQDIVVGPLGNVYATGRLTTSGASTFSFGNGVTLNPSLDCGFLAKFDTSGLCLWAVDITSTVPVVCTGIAYDNTNLYVCGYAEGSGVTLTAGDQGSPMTAVTMPTRTGSTGYVSNAFVLTYTILGNPIDSFVSAAAAGADRFLGIDATSSTVVAVGEFRPNLSSSSFNYSSDVLTGVGGTWNALLVVMNSSLSPTRARTVYTAGAVSAGSAFHSVAVTSAYIALGGYQTGTESFPWSGTTSWTGTSTGDNGLVVLCDSAGTPIWSGGPQGDASGSSIVQGLAFNSAETYLYAVGRVSAGTQTWESYPATSTPAFVAPQSSSPFVVKIAPASGTSTWVTTTTTGSGPAEAFTVAPGVSGTINIAGTQPGTAGVSWGYDLTTSGPASGDNPLLFQVFD